MTTFEDREEPEYKYSNHQLGLLILVVSPFYDKFMNILTEEARDEVLLHIRGNQTSWKKESTRRHV